MAHNIHMYCTHNELYAAVTIFLSLSVQDSELIGSIPLDYDLCVRVVDDPKTQVSAGHLTTHTDHRTTRTDHMTTHTDHMTTHTDHMTLYSIASKSTRPLE